MQFRSLLEHRLRRGAVFCDEDLRQLRHQVADPLICWLLGDVARGALSR